MISERLVVRIHSFLYFYKSFLNNASLVKLVYTLDLKSDSLVDCKFESCKRYYINSESSSMVRVSALGVFGCRFESYLSERVFIDQFIYKILYI